MERLTNKREADAQREAYKRRIENGYPRNIPEERFLRLAAYEDTGLTPDEIDDDRLRELARADREGRVVVLPCKVGDTYYTIECFCSEDGYYDEKQLHHSWDCEYCSLDNCDKEHRVVEHIFQSERSIYEKKGWLGECAWLTCEEAEEALRRAEDG